MSSTHLDPAPGHARAERKEKQRVDKTDRKAIIKRQASQKHSKVDRGESNAEQTDTKNTILQM